VCGLASASPIATGKHIGDCDLVPSTVSFVHTSAGSWRCKEHGTHNKSEWLGVLVYRLYYCLFIKNVPEITETQDTRTHTQLQHPPPSLPRSRSTKKNETRRRARDRSKVPSRCKRGEIPPNEDVQDPLIIVRGKELVAPDPTAREHHPGSSWSGPAPADQDRTAGAPQLCSTQQ